MVMGRKRAADGGSPSRINDSLFLSTITAIRRGMLTKVLLPDLSPVATALVCHFSILFSCIVAYVDCGTCSHHLHGQEVDLLCCGSDICFLIHNLYRPPLTPPLWGELLHRGGVRRVFLCLYFFCLHTPKALPIEGEMPTG